MNQRKLLGREHTWSGSWMMQLIWINKKEAEGEEQGLKPGGNMSLVEVGGPYQGLMKDEFRAE